MYVQVPEKTRKKYQMPWSLSYKKWSLLKRLELDLPHNPTKPLLGKYSISYAVLYR